MSFLLDTDICSAHLKGVSHVSSKILQFSGRLHISAISLCELYAWCDRAKAPPSRLEMLNVFLRDATVLPVDVAVSRRFGQLRAALLDNGQPSPLFDLVVAATALTYELAIVTHNVKHFANIPGLQVVDWLER